MTRITKVDKVAIAEALVYAITHSEVYDREAVFPFAVALRKLELPAEEIASLTLAAGRRAEWLLTPGYEVGCGDLPAIPYWLATVSESGLADPYVQSVLSALRASAPVQAAPKHSAQIIAFPVHRSA
jgi:hypothetical protein